MSLLCLKEAFSASVLGFLVWPDWGLKNGEQRSYVHRIHGRVDVFVAKFAKSCCANAYLGHILPLEFILRVQCDGPRVQCDGWVH
jgi:hypothetical protein